MKTLPVKEASQSLADLLRRAAGGERIAIYEGGCTVLLQPLPDNASTTRELTAREALRRLQSRSRLTATEAQNYLREVQAERLVDGRRNGQ